MNNDVKEAVTKALAGHQYRVFPGQCSCQEPGEFMTTPAHTTHIAEIMLETAAFSHTTIDGQRLTWKQLYEPVRATYLKLARRLITQGWRKQ